MSTNATCPAPILLSQYLDNEGESSEVQQMSSHIATCAQCRTQLQQLERVNGGMKAMLSKISASLTPEQTSSGACLSPEIVAGYVNRLLSREESLQAEQHLHICDWCLQEVADANRITAALAIPQRLPVPDALKQKVVALWEPSPVEKATAALSRLVVQVAKKGMALIEQHLVPPFINVEEVLAPAGAYRTAEGPATLDLNIKTAQTEIRVTSVQEGEGMSLRMTFLDPTQEVLSGQRVFLRQQGRPIFSAKTDQKGMLRTPHLEPGTYEIDCPGTQAVFALEVRS